MPYKNHRVIVVTPAGRQRYLELLIPQVLNYIQLGIVDEYHLWMNTTVQSDIDYMISMSAKHSFIKCVSVNQDFKQSGSTSIGVFFKYCIDDNTVYVRFDDDIVVLDKPDNFKQFLDYRINNPQFFLVFANILNNAITSHIHQRHGTLNTTKGISGYECMDNIGWNNPEFALNLHEQVLQNLKKDGNLEAFHMPPWLLHHYERVSINCISWLGKEFRAICNGNIGISEEQELSSDIPISKQVKNSIFGKFCVVHFAFYTQRELLDNSTLLEEYKSLVL